jgi:peptidoglycan/LPS O-acetylase OafA/YrhL
MATFSTGADARSPTPFKPTSMPSSSLADHAVGRDNNLNLMRLTAASMVLVAHSFSLSTGQTDTEPWRVTFGMTPGSTAVEIFFLLSGLLLTQSLMRRPDAAAFVRARLLRIFPGLIVSVALTVLVLGPLFTNLPLVAYLRDPLTWKHLIKNALAFPHVEFFLPGVFETTPYPRAVNGSLWTLRHELTCYAMLLGAWMGSMLLGRRVFFPVAVVLITVVSFALRVSSLMDGQTLEEPSSRLFSSFFLGSCAALFARFIPLRNDVALLAIAALVLGAWMPRWMPAAYLIALPYLLVWMAYVPAGAVRSFNRLGDYSYGVYVYAFPVQQALAAAVPGIGVWALMGSSMAVTLALAIVSWHAIEAPASRWGTSKSRLPGRPASDVGSERARSAS